jgi:NADPH-dependent 2,4-dienoyl-CoA reductase/sulfur reductase-like enzyme
VSAAYEVIVIGTGPAGLAAAQLAAEHKARTLVLDEQRAPGGQIYRAIEATTQSDRPELGESYFAGRALVQGFRDAAVDYLPGATVWQVSRDREVGYSLDGEARILSAPEIILATGAQERPFPVPGWTLPGVMTVGGAQVLLKDSALGMENAVFAGSGPLLYLAACEGRHRSDAQA